MTAPEHVFYIPRRLVVAIALAGALLIPATSSATRSPAFGSSTVFARVPAPGHPFGVLPTDDAVYVTTSAGNAFHLNFDAEFVFTYSPSGGSPIAKTPVRASTRRGLYGMAEDAQGRLYVVDMNGRILRFTPDSHSLRGPEVYATAPEPFRAAGWESSMWVFPAFDENGNLYVTDDSQGAIWRIPPNGKPAVWFEDPEFLSFPTVGLQGIAIGPDHKMYVALVARPDRGGESAIFRLPITAAPPRLDQVELFHEFPLDPGNNRSPVPGAVDLAFSRSGNLYVTLSTSQLAVLAPDGHELRRISNDAFDFELGVRFQGILLLVANSNVFPPENPAHWQIFKVFVGEPGLPLIRPVIPTP